MKKNNIYDFLTIVLLDIGISCLPFSLIPMPDFLICILQILAQGLIYVLIRLILKRGDLIINNERLEKKAAIWFVPLFLVCFSNFFCLLSSSNTLEPYFDIVLLLKIILSICIAFNEEIIFRKILITNMNNSDKALKKVVISSAVFGLCHLTHFLSSFNPMDLTIVVYTFGIGIILGLIYIYTKSLIFAFIFHAAYNIFNNDLAGNWIVYHDGMKSFFIINSIIAIIVIIYLIVFYLIQIKKEKETPIKR